jgi:hypothetical protein
MEVGHDLMPVPADEGGESFHGLEPGARHPRAQPGQAAALFIIVLFCAWSSPELGRVIA